MTLRPVAPGVHVAEGNLRIAGLALGARMTVLELSGGLLVHSPIALPPSSIAGLGEPRWVVAPNLMHHLYVGPWVEAGLEGWAAPGLGKKRPDVRFSGELIGEPHPFGSDVRVYTLRCFGLTNEVVLLHRPSRTLVVSDLVFNIPRHAPWFTRVAMRCIGGYPGCRVTALERWGMRRGLAREDLSTIAGWDFDRVIMAHGQIIETGGKAALLDAFRWLSLPSLPA